MLKKNIAHNSQKTTEFDLNRPYLTRRQPFQLQPVLRSTSLMDCSLNIINRGTQREYTSKRLKHSFVKRILVFKR